MKVTTDQKVCRVRKDLLEKGTQVTVGSYGLNTAQLFPYKWENEDDFFIKIKGRWHQAESIDFEFPTQEQTQEGQTEEKPKFFPNKSDHHIKIYLPLNIDLAEYQRTIEAAPDMLEALKNIVDYLGEDWSNDPQVKKTIEVIAKAEGRAK